MSSGEMVDYQAKYESLLRNVLSDLNSEVLTAQSRAEKNAEASGAYCSKLKRRLQERERELEESRAELLQVRQELCHTQAELHELREMQSKLEQEAHHRGGETGRHPGREVEQPIAADSTCMSGDGHVTSSVVLEFLSGLAGLSVSRCQQSSSGIVFHCEVIDGSLTGHTFTLSLDLSSSEFTYQPVQNSSAVLAGSVLADTTCFPDYMQSRFLLNLLNSTFLQPDS